MGSLKPEIDLLQQKLASKPLPEDLKARCQRMIDRLAAVDAAGGQSLVDLESTSKYIDWVIQLPFGQYTQDNLDLAHAQQVLDEGHYGLLAIKETILEYIASQKLLQDRAQTPANVISASQNPVQVPQSYNQSPLRGRSPILCFVGVQGIGKTTMAKSIAVALGRSFHKLALGAFASAQELRGTARIEPNSEPGQILKALISSKSMNPVILLDEIDKVSESGGVKFDIMATLLEILDPEQNRNFVDRYLDFPLDLSQVIFITTANNLTGLSAALLDRLEVIRFSSYTDEEKQVIARDYLLPKVREITGIGSSQLQFSDDVWPLLIRPLGFDPGIRQLERNLLILCRKVAKLIVEQKVTSVTLTPQNFREFFPEQIAVFS